MEAHATQRSPSGRRSSTSLPARQDQAPCMEEPPGRPTHVRPWRPCKGARARRHMLGMPPNATACQPARRTFDALVELARSCDEWGVLELAFGGGEPTVFPRFAALRDRTCHRIARMRAGRYRGRALPCRDTRAMSRSESSGPSRSRETSRSRAAHKRVSAGARRLRHASRPSASGCGSARWGGRSPPSCRRRRTRRMQTSCGPYAPPSRAACTSGSWCPRCVRIGRRTQ